MAQSDWEDAKTLASQAINILESQSPPIDQKLISTLFAGVRRFQPSEESLSISEDIAKGWRRHCEQSVYLLINAKAQRQLGCKNEAIAALEQAVLRKAEPHTLEQHPELYIEILEELRSLYLEQNQYLRSLSLSKSDELLSNNTAFVPSSEQHLYNPLIGIGAAFTAHRWQLLPLVDYQMSIA